jgi:hypothetical protein
MRAARSALRVILGLALIVHGLANAVYPLRGLDAVAPGQWMLTVTALYVVAILGFVAAGLGVLGVRPLRATVMPLVLVAGVCTIGSQWRLTDADLWPGVVLSLLLPPATALWATFDRRPVGINRRLRMAGDAVGLALLAWVGVATLTWPYTRTWGAASDEWATTLPGDRAPRTPALEILHAVTIDAPPTAVWPWLVQLGQDRAGFYSYDALERLFGADVHNVFELRQEWQSRHVGDRVYAGPEGYLGSVLRERPGWNVLVAEPDHALVLENWGAFVLQPGEHGGTRLLIRSTISHRRIPPWAAAVNFTAFELPHYIMQRRMMLRIKELAERPHETRALRG